MQAYPSMSKNPCNGCEPLLRPDPRNVTSTEPRPAAVFSYALDCEYIYNASE
jgi:hypothetical protein